MICFEVYRNGQKICTAGIGDYGVLTAILTWVSHHPESLARWAAEGSPNTEPTEMDFSVGGLYDNNSSVVEHLKWARLPIVVGDEISIRVVDSQTTDPPSERRQDDPARDVERKKKYVREAAKEFGWEICTEPGTPLNPSASTPDR
jgi:hypothetical protein